METMYVDPSCIVDISRLLAAETGVCVGGPADGEYFIAVLLQGRKKEKHIVFTYHTEAARDAAFAELGKKVLAYAARHCPACGHGLEEE